MSRTFKPHKHKPRCCYREIKSERSHKSSLRVQQRHALRSIDDYDDYDVPVEPQHTIYSKSCGYLCYSENEMCKDLDSAIDCYNNGGEMHYYIFDIIRKRISKKYTNDNIVNMPIDILRDAIHAYYMSKGGAANY